MKCCFKCDISKPLSEFYRHSKMRDGHLNKCKSCTLRDARIHRRDNDSVRERDRNRAKLPHRVAGRRRVAAAWRASNPEAYRAQTALGNAIRDGKAKRLPCEVCGSKRSHGHHRDYAKPLDVIWLCARHHHAAHGLMRSV